MRPLSRASSCHCRYHMGISLKQHSQRDERRHIFMGFLRLSTNSSVWWNRMVPIQRWNSTIIPDLCHFVTAVLCKSRYRFTGTTWSGVVVFIVIVQPISQSNEPISLTRSHLLRFLKWFNGKGRPISLMGILALKRQCGIWTMPPMWLNGRGSVSFFYVVVEYNHF